MIDGFMVKGDANYLCVLYLRNLRQCPAGGFYVLGAAVFYVPARAANDSNRQPRITGPMKKSPVSEAWVVVPVERIELPTFGLQNRCSTAELNRLMR